MPPPQQARRPAGPVPQAVRASPQRVPAPAQAPHALRAATRAGRCSPADRSSCEPRSRRRARRHPPRRPHRRRRPRARPRRASRRSTRDAARSPCSRTGSRSRSSCLLSEPCRQTTRGRLQERAPAHLPTSRCRCPGAGPPCRASRDRRRTVAARGPRPARSRPEQWTRAARERTPARGRVAAQEPPLLSDLRTASDGSKTVVLLSILATRYDGRARCATRL
jgi:hypothetical protein